MNFQKYHKVLRTDSEESGVLQQEPAFLETDPNRLLKKGIWLYFLLLIFEGGLRKWFLPGLATPLLVIRDPIALWLIILAWQRGLLAANILMNTMMLIGTIGLFTAIFIGHGNLYVALYGARMLLLQFPLIFVIGNVFDRDDVIKIGKAIVWIAIPMTILTAIQFYSPQTAWVNRGVGGEGGAGFTGALGFFRPPGTFSFTNGNSLFFAFSAPFILYFWFDSKALNRVVVLAATIALLAAIPLSISRGLFFSVIVSVCFAVMAISRKPGYMGQMIVSIVGIMMVFTLLSKLSFFQTATEAFTARFENANKAEGGVESVLLDRYLGGMIGALTKSGDLPVFGVGFGMGTNVGSQLLTGKLEFLVAEGEWGRMIGELGPLLGLTVVLIRLSFSAWLTVGAYKKLSYGDLLPWMLLSFGLLIVPQGTWAQPTSLGFCIMSGGLIMASLNPGKEEITL